MVSIAVSKTVDMGSTPVAPAKIRLKMDYFVSSDFVRSIRIALRSVECKLASFLSFMFVVCVRRASLEEIINLTSFIKNYVVYRII